jgi:hypothetical protein
MKIKLLEKLFLAHVDILFLDLHLRCFEGRRAGRSPSSYIFLHAHTSMDPQEARSRLLMQTSFRSSHCSSADTVAAESPRCPPGGRQINNFQDPRSRPSSSKMVSFDADLDCVPEQQPSTYQHRRRRSEGSCLHDLHMDGAVMSVGTALSRPISSPIGRREAYPRKQSFLRKIKNLFVGGRSSPASITVDFSLNKVTSLPLDDDDEDTFTFGCQSSRMIHASNGMDPNIIDMV